MLWQPLYGEWALGARQEEAEEEAEEGAEEEEEAGDHQPPFPCNNSSLCWPLPTYASWERSPESSKGKERKPTAS